MANALLCFRKHPNEPSSVPEGQGVQWCHTRPAEQKSETHHSPVVKGGRRATRRRCRQPPPHQWSTPSQPPNPTILRPEHAGDGILVPTKNEFRGGTSTASPAILQRRPRPAPTSAVGGTGQHPAAQGRDPSGQPSPSRSTPGPDLSPPAQIQARCRHPRPRTRRRWDALIRLKRIYNFLCSMLLL
jgi:hypothetical protein